MHGFPFGGRRLACGERCCARGRARARKVGRERGGELLELGDADLELGHRLLAQLGERRPVGVGELGGGVLGAPVVEIETRAQGELLAHEHVRTRPEQLGEALLGAERGHARSSPPPARSLRGARDTKLARVQPPAVGDVLALAPSRTDRERLICGHLVHVRVARGDAVHVEDAVEQRELIPHGALDVELAQPRFRLTVGGDGRGIDERRARRRHGSGLGLGVDRGSARRSRGAAHALPAPARANARAERFQDDHPLGVAAGARADQVTAVRRAELPRELELHEQEQVLGHDFNVSLLTMADDRNLANRLRERLGDSTEERLGKALTDLLENPLITGAVGRAFDAREKASQAQELAMGALNIPSAADIERLTRRVRSISQRLEGIEDGIDRIGRAVEERLQAIEEKLAGVSQTLEELVRSQPKNEVSTTTTESPPRRSTPKFTRRKRAPVDKLPTGAPSTETPPSGVPAQSPVP